MSGQRAAFSEQSQVSTSSFCFMAPPCMQHGLLSSAARCGRVADLASQCVYGCVLVFRNVYTDRHINNIYIYICIYIYIYKSHVHHQIVSAGTSPLGTHPYFCNLMLIWEVRR